MIWTFDYYGYEIYGLRKLEIIDLVERELWKVPQWPNLSYTNWGWSNNIDKKPFRIDEVELKDKLLLKMKKSKSKKLSALDLIKLRRLKSKDRFQSSQLYLTEADTENFMLLLKRKKLKQLDYIRKKWSLKAPLRKAPLDQGLFSVEWHFQVKSQRKYPWVKRRIEKRKRESCYFRLIPKEYNSYKMDDYVFDEKVLLLYNKNVIVSFFCCEKCLCDPIIVENIFVKNFPRHRKKGKALPPKIKKQVNKKND